MQNILHCNTCQQSIVEKPIQGVTKFCKSCGKSVFINSTIESSFLEQNNINSHTNQLQNTTNTTLISTPSSPQRIDTIKYIEISNDTWFDKNRKIIVGFIISFALICLVLITYFAFTYYINKDKNVSNDSILKVEGKYPETATTYLTESDIAMFSKEELRIMRNEIFARKGFIFEKEDMKQYFNNQSWYKPIYRDYHEVAALLSEIEKANVALINKVEQNNIENLSHESMIKEIKMRYNSIINANYPVTTFKTNCENGDVQYQLEGTEIKRIVVQKGKFFFYFTDEYYFWDNQLFFVLTQIHSEGNGRMATGSDEEMRFYIYNGQGIECKKDEKNYTLSNHADDNHTQSTMICKQNIIDNLIKQGNLLKDKYYSHQFQDMPCD